MSKLTNMAQTKGYDSPAEVAPPRYPYGLTLNLDTESLEALGLKNDLPEVGATFKVVALATVTSVEERETAGGGASCNVCLQVTDMAVDETDSGASADKLYKKA